jgi:beta-glucosidase
MAEFLANLISPVLIPMGVSYADLLVYINQLGPYLAIGGAALLLLIAVLIGAHWMKKGWRAFARIQAAIGFLLVVTILINAACYGPLNGPVSAFLNASSVELSDDMINASLSITERIGTEGFVLLKNDENTLPLADGTSRLNVFGWASTQPYLGGTGSSASGSVAAVDILGSLQNAGYETNQTLTDLYTSYASERPGADMFGQNLTLPEPIAAAYTDEILKEAKEFSDTAVIVIARGGGENYDLPTDMYGVIHGTYNISSQVSNNPDGYPYTKVTYTNNGDYDDFDEGESYLELSNTEEALLQLVCDNFVKVILIVNSCNPMELGFVNEYPIDAVLLAPAPGAQGFAALGSLIKGELNPSGRTADTWVYDLMNTPTIHNIGINAYTNIDDIKAKVLAADATYQGSLSFVNYVEGIYVGYKFYETADIEGLIDYASTVQYPFGFGLSYTTFEEKITSFEESDDTVTLEVTVTNTGNAAGKDVVELYFTPPYTNGGIEKAAVNLIDFEKTSTLRAGSSEVVRFTVNKEDLASYDSTGIKATGGGYVLEAGEYTLSVRSDSHTVSDSVSFTVATDVIYSEGRSSDVSAPVNQFEDYSRGEFVLLSRADGFANYNEACAEVLTEDALIMSDQTRDIVSSQLWGYYDYKNYEDKSLDKPNQGDKNNLTLAEMTGLAYDDEKWDLLLDQLSFKEMSALVNTGGWQTVAVESISKIATSDCDGPAGLNNFITGASGTTYPAEVLMAQTWSKEVAYDIGSSMGSEFAAANNYGWYGPAMNIHRNAFAGRNFEYYSEDGILSGMIAVNEANGAAQYGVYPYLKHFAMNDQELGRTSVLLTYSDEQAIREVYLKPFEIAVKGFTGKALAVMSSYNWIGTVPSCANSALLQNVLRDEWGFKGMVETDYDGSYGFMITDAVIRNGGDLMLGYGTYETNELSKKSVTEAVSLRRASHNILYTIANSGYYGVSTVNTEAEGEDQEEAVETAAVAEAPVQAVSNMDRLFSRINLTAGISLAVLEALLIAGQIIISKKKKAAAFKS